MVDGAEAAQSRWPLPDWTWLAWPPLSSLAVQIAVSTATGLHITAFIAAQFAGLAIWLARVERMKWDPPVVPTWVFHTERRVICGEIGGALTVATAFIPLAFESLHTRTVLAITVLPIVAAAIYILPQLVWITRGLPELQVLPEGIVVRGRHVSWDDIERVELRSMLRPRVAVEVRSRRPAALREFHVHANLLYLLDLIGYYAAHPERRAAIGTAEEAERITAALLQARLATPFTLTPVPLPS